MSKAYKKRSKRIVSYTMSKILSKNTSIECFMGKALRLSGIGYKTQHPVEGKPDFAIPLVKMAIFCDSAFWHGYKWHERKNNIRANRQYWIPKIEGNIARDKKVSQLLRGRGWTVIRFWEHEIIKDINKCVEKVIRKIEAAR